MSFNLSSVAIIGLGNIGSQLAAAVARNLKIERILLVDSGGYTTHNLTRQLIEVDADGSPKVEYVAAQLARIRPELSVEVIAQRLQQIPMGVFMAYDVILLCVDNNITRQYCGQLAYRLEKILIDAAVGFNQYFQIRVFPGKSGACFECGLGAADYQLLGEEYSCGSLTNIATDSSFELGGIAAAFQSSQLNNILNEGLPSDSYQIFGDIRTPGIERYDLAPSEVCRFDHQPIGVPCRIGLNTSISQVCTSSFAVLGTVGFASQTICQSCHGKLTLSPPSLVRHLESPRLCDCGGILSFVPISLVSQLRKGQLSHDESLLPLSSLGIRQGDILRLGQDSKIYKIVGTVDG